MLKTDFKKSEVKKLFNEISNFQKDIQELLLESECHNFNKLNYSMLLTDKNWIEKFLKICELFISDLSTKEKFIKDIIKISAKYFN